jgi:hypothetical protein
MGPDAGVSSLTAQPDRSFAEEHPIADKALTAGFALAVAIIGGLLLTWFLGPAIESRKTRAAEAAKLRFASQSTAVLCAQCNQEVPAWFLGEPLDPPINKPWKRTPLPPVPRCRNCDGSAHRYPLPAESPEDFEKSLRATLGR